LCVEYVSLLVKFKLQLLYPRDIKFWTISNMKSTDNS
jgi:hypothetical protein